MNFLNNLFSDKGTVSEMRVMAFLAFLTGAGIAFYGMNKQPVDYSGITMLSGTFLAAAFGGKVYQKRIEQDGAKSDSTTDLKND